MSQNRAQKYVFCHFFKFVSLVFLEISQDDSLKHCLTTSRSKTNAKELGGEGWMGGVVGNWIQK